MASTQSTLLGSLWFARETAKNDLVRRRVPVRLLPSREDAEAEDALV
jgi:hypothetical protein